MNDNEEICEPSLKTTQSLTGLKDVLKILNA